MPEILSPIVITGVGVVSPLGIGYEEFADGLASQKKAIRRAPSHFESTGVKWASQIDGFEAKKWVKPRKSIKLMCEEIQFSVGSAEMAIQHSGLDVKDVDMSRFGVVMGSEFLYGPPEELVHTYLAALETNEFSARSFGENIGKLFPLWMLRYLPNMPACHIGIAQQAIGPNNSVVQGETSCLSALTEAVGVMERGWADVMITGGVGSELQNARVVNLAKDLFYQGDDMEGAGRPFDARRDGHAASHGAATFVLETEEHAKARGATPLAVVRGIGRAFEYHLPFEKGVENAASQKAIERSIRLALERTSCSAKDVDHVNAHGLGTKLSDRLEALAIQSKLGQTPTTAIKSYLGNAGAGSAALELAASIVAFDRGEVPATLGYEVPDPECPLNVITDPRPVEKSFALILNQSLLGQAVAAIIERP